MYIKYFESFKNHDNLFVVDVQKSFRKFFTEMYINELKKYCKNFNNVYQIWDNHIDGKNVDTEYLYKKSPIIPVHRDLYSFPNQKDIIEKRYNYNVTIDFYRKILDTNTFKRIKNKENKNLLKVGDSFKTKEGTILIFIGNKHRWFHCPYKLYSLFKKLVGKEIYIIGGSDSECLNDIVITGETLGCIMKRDHRYIYSASHCPIPS